MQISIDNSGFLASDEIYWKAYLPSVRTAFIATALTLLVDYALARSPARWRKLQPILIVLSFRTSLLTRPNQELR
ncbi:hypothetical protein IB235_12095 [Paracoccus sp. PAR01]|nr:hypothetical protein [Paracoccus sp. PAR01]